MLPADLGNLIELLLCLKLRSAGTDDVEASCIPVAVDDIIVDNDEIIIH